MKQLKEDQEQLTSSIELLENLIQHQNQLLEIYRQELVQIKIELFKEQS
jgi:DNA gyrase/topoisomerase IV subunit A